jgi:hypothetical protein
MDNLYVMQNEDYETYYWNYKYGWSETRVPDTFTEMQKAEIGNDLPPQGKWVELKEEKP